MKKYLNEIIIITLQALLFYVFPLTVGPTDAMGMVVLMIAATFAFSFFLGTVSGNNMKYLYPAAAAILFIPSVFLYYNESALVHALWYLAVSCAGLATGALIRRFRKK